ncbi:MAG TPA: hypothetical protein VFV66_08865 [Nonomuraea sp.]|nr:hypothetical protein [Nonomuraea sp.]
MAAYSTKTWEIGTAAPACHPGPGTGVGDTVNMPVPPNRLKERIGYIVNHHGTQHRPRLEDVTITWRGSFGYLIGWDGFLPGMNEQIKLCRIEYLGDDEDWGFAIYDPATETYVPSRLTTGRDTGHPTEAFDTAAIIHLAGYTT